jgi:hypothetical protein
MAAYLDPICYKYLNSAERDEVEKEISKKYSASSTRISQNDYKQNANTKKTIESFAEQCGTYKKV